MVLSGYVCIFTEGEFSYRNDHLFPLATFIFIFVAQKALFDPCSLRGGGKRLPGKGKQTVKQSLVF
jgi:hypothetical protein